MIPKIQKQEPQTTETSFSAQVIPSSRSSLHVKNKHSRQLHFELFDEDNGSSVSDMDPRPTWQPGRKCGLAPIVCSHSLSEII